MAVHFGDRQFEVLCALVSANKLLNSKILWQSERPVYQDAVLTEVLVNLNFCLLHAKFNLKSEIVFSDDIIIRTEISNVTELIRFFRNAACHHESPNKYFEDINNPKHNKSIFNTMFGKGIEQIDSRCESKYDDDVAFFCGINVLYLKRHIERAYDEVVKVHDGFIFHHVLTAFNLIN